MEKNLKKFLAQAKSVQLSEEEKAAMRFQLAASGLELTSHERSSIRRSVRKNMSHGTFAGVIENIFLSLRPTSFAIATFLLFIVAGTGMVFAAERSLPGDLLYAVKRHITEPLLFNVGYAAGEEHDRALWQLERRLEEARRLSMERPESDNIDNQVTHDIDQLADEVVKNNVKKKGVADTQLDQILLNGELDLKAAPSATRRIRSERFLKTIRDVRRRGAEALPE